MEAEVLDKAVPHIAGQQGYPQRYQPSHDAMVLYTAQQQRFIEHNLTYQKNVKV